MNYDHSILDGHEQQYKLSCIPSAVEMVLKLLRKVDKDYYNLQAKWREKYGDEKSGSFTDFNEVTIEGVTFERISDCAQELFKAIDYELNSGKLVLVSLTSAPNKYHIYVIYDHKNDNFQAFTKYFGVKETEYYSGSLKTHIEQMRKTDILIYKITGPSSTGY